MLADYAVCHLGHPPTSR